MSEIDILAKTLVIEMIKEFGRSTFNEDFAQRYIALLTPVPRFYAAVYAVQENALSYYVDYQLQRHDKPELLKMIRAEFSILAYGLHFDQIISLNDLVLAPFERNALEKYFRQLRRPESIESLMTHPARFGSHYQTLQDIRCAEYIGFLVGSPNENLREALTKSFCFWFFGQQSMQQDWVSIVDEITDNAEWAAALIVDKAQSGRLPLSV